MWELRKFTITLFWQKIRESNGFTNNVISKLLIWRKFFIFDTKMLISVHNFVKHSVKKFSLMKPAHPNLDYLYLLIKSPDWAGQVCCNVFTKTVSFTKFWHQHYISRIRRTSFSSRCYFPFWCRIQGPPPIPITSKSNSNSKQWHQTLIYFLRKIPWIQLWNIPVCVRIYHSTMWKCGNFRISAVQILREINC